LDTLYILPILLFSIVVHEVAHGWMALRLGDTTARDLGRLTLNPIPHIDPIGSVLVPLISLFSTGSVFIAWAKPVPVNPMMFRNPRRDDILVSTVGPFSNLLVAGLCAVLYVVSVLAIGPMENVPEGLSTEVATFVINMFGAGITLNIFLAVFNMIPVPPLDGSHVLASVLPDRLGDQYRQIGFFGIIVVIFLMRVEVVRDFMYMVVLTLRLPYEWFIHMMV
jgi:Zn-dependent protease